MGKKYIVELPETDSEFDFASIRPYAKPDLERVRIEAYKDGYDDGFGRKIDASYQEGLFDAWEAARKIENLPEAEKFEIFAEYDMFHIMRRYTATEAIEKIRQYEQRQEEQIRVGDEVATDAGNRASVLYEDPDGTQVFVFKSDGTAAWWTKSALHRTGRNFFEIATVLEKMRGSE